MVDLTFSAAAPAWPPGARALSRVPSSFCRLKNVAADFRFALTAAPVAAARPSSPPKMRAENEGSQGRVRPLVTSANYSDSSAPLSIKWIQLPAKERCLLIRPDPLLSVEVLSGWFLGNKARLRRVWRGGGSQKNDVLGKRYSAPTTMLFSPKNPDCPSVSSTGFDPTR